MILMTNIRIFTPIICFTFYNIYSQNNSESNPQKICDLMTINAGFGLLKLSLYDKTEISTRNQIKYAIPN